MFHSARSLAPGVIDWCGPYLMFEYGLEFLLALGGCVCVSAPVSGCEREYVSVGYLDTLHKALNNLCNAGPSVSPF